MPANTRCVAGGGPNVAHEGAPSHTSRWRGRLGAARSHTHSTPLLANVWSLMSSAAPSCAPTGPYATSTCVSVLLGLKLTEVTGRCASTSSHPRCSRPAPMPCPPRGSAPNDSTLLSGAMPRAASMTGPAHCMNDASFTSSPASPDSTRAVALPRCMAGAADARGADDASTLNANTSASVILLRSSGTWLAYEREGTSSVCASSSLASSLVCTAAALVLAYVPRAMLNRSYSLRGAATNRSSMAITSSCTNFIFLRASASLLRAALASASVS
mmetsp:Transcript_33521/g.84932  ORF Transcript_33521/g.84932 Transcript_33521/m.84932 type:complete len:272 (+) Transcript_33521:482-1297(+)